VKTVLETIQAGAGYLEKKGVENGRLNMQHLVAHVLGCDRMQLYVDFDRPLGEESLVPLRELLTRRSEGEPLQHLLGKVAFAGHDFCCDGRALIPRPETEELVEKLIGDVASGGQVPRRILDMGTGSGVIGLSLGMAWKDELKALVLADFSQDALALAGENATALGLVELDCVELVQSDLFASLSGRKFDLIVANLPYISAAEVPTLSREVQRDPVMALDGGVAGTELMQRFIAEAPAYLNEGGGIAMEYGMGQADHLRGLLEESGWQNIKVLRDLAKVERFVLAER
jgi:release factor glutamine methyltransferase